MHPKTHPNPGVMAKDVFRGIRFTLKQGAKVILRNGPRQLPKQFEAASSNFLQTAEQLTGTVDNIVKKILGLEFDEGKFKAPSFATESSQDGPHEQILSDASNLYFALTLAAKHVGVKSLLVSEVICVRLIAEGVSFKRSPGDQPAEALSAELFQRLIATGVLGDPPGIPGSHNADHLEDVATIAFATVLWAYVDRGEFGDSELEILQICCDIAAQKRTEIVNARASDERLSALFKYALETV